jgi:hypothetical protein
MRRMLIGRLLGTVPVGWVRRFHQHHGWRLGCRHALLPIGGSDGRGRLLSLLQCSAFGLLPNWVDARSAEDRISIFGRGGALCSFIQGPMYLVAMGAAAFQLDQSLIATMRAKEESEYSATQDALTGLLNRAGLKNFSEQ